MGRVTIVPRGTAVPGAAASVQLAAESGSVSSHTFLGLGIIGVCLAVVWLIRRSRA